MIAYLDTSAALRVLVRTADKAAADAPRDTRDYLDRLIAGGDMLVASELLRVELLCQANRQPNLESDDIRDFLVPVSLARLDDGALAEAPATPGRLRTLDAIHLAVALRLGADLMIAFDRELRRAAASVGMLVGPDLPDSP